MPYKQIENVTLKVIMPGIVSRDCKIDTRIVKIKDNNQILKLKCIKLTPRITNMNSEQTI